MYLTQLSKSCNNYTKWSSLFICVPKLWVGTQSPGLDAMKEAAKCSESCDSQILNDMIYVSKSCD